MIQLGYKQTVPEHITQKNRALRKKMGDSADYVTDASAGLIPGSPGISDLPFLYWFRFPVASALSPSNNRKEET